MATRLYIKRVDQGLNDAFCVSGWYDEKMDSMSHGQDSLEK